MVTKIDATEPANPRLLFLLRFLLPCFLVFTSCTNISLISLPFFLAFLKFFAKPAFTFKKGFPLRTLVFLFFYSILLLIVQIICSILIATNTLKTASVSETLTSIGVARFDIGGWQGVRTIIGPVLISLVLLAAVLTEDHVGDKQYLQLWFVNRKNDHNSDFLSDCDIHNGIDNPEEQLLEDEETTQLANQEEGVAITVPTRHTNDDDDNSKILPELPTQKADSRETELSKFTIFIAGTGGVFWSVLSLGITAISHSSLLTFTYLVCFAVCAIFWAFQSKWLAPSHSPRRVLRFVKLLRIYSFFYLLAIFIVQLEWLSPVRDSRYGLFVGLVPLDTDKPQGWSYIMAFASTMVFYIMSGLFSKAIRAAFLHGENLPPADPSTVNHRFMLHAKEVVLYRSIIHVSSVALLSWSLVFPGIASLPIMIFSFLYFVLPAWRQTHKVDYFIFYLVVLELMHFIYSAAAEVSEISDSTAVRLLGLRRFQPQFGMNVSHAIAVVLFCFTIYLKRYLAKHPTHLQDQRHTNDEGPQSSNLLPDSHLIDRLFFRSEYSAVSRGTFTPLRVIIDQLALASLYVSGGANASVLNVVFIVALTLLCFSQSFAPVRKQKVFSLIWLLVLVYASGFLIITSSICRSATGLWNCSYETIGIEAATTIQVMAYAFTVVFAAVQFHFTWPWAYSEEDADRIRNFRSPFWAFLRGYFIFFAYAALLLYPLGSPANYLSYAYLVFLLFCILVEILLRGRTIPQTSIHIRSRDIIGRLWVVIVIFSGVSMLSRYVLRFRSVAPSKAVSLWVFGLDRGSPGFALTFGDAIVLIAMSLQSRLFAIDKIVTKDVEGTDGTDGNREAPVTAPNSSVLNREKSGFLTAAVAAFSAAATEEEKAAQAARLIRRLRHSLPVERTYALLHRVYAKIRFSLQRLLFRFSYVFEAWAILAAAVWLDGISLFGAVYLILGCILIFFDQRPIVTIGGERMTPWGMRVLPPTLATLSFSLLSLQYLYMIFSASGKSWGVAAEYLGLEDGILSSIPITHDAILGHALVFTMAFLQRGTRRWANAEERKRRNEDGEQLIVQTIEDPDSNADALASAVSVSDALPGVRSLNDSRNGSPPLTQQKPQNETLDSVDAVEDGSIDEITPEKEKSERLRDSQLLFAPTGERLLRYKEVTFASREESDMRVYLKGAAADTTGRAPGGTDEGRQMLESWSFQEPRSDNIRTRQERIATTYGTVREMTHSLGIPTSRLDEMIAGQPQCSAEAEIRRQYVGRVQGERTGLHFGFVRWAAALATMERGIKTVGEVFSLLKPFWLQWGFDITYMYLVIGGTITRTVFSVIYIAFVLGLCAVSRKRIAGHWAQATLVLITLVLVQYVLSLGLPRSIGPDAKWTGMKQEWAEWLYLDRFNQSRGRKADLTVGFLAVICAGITLDAVRSQEPSRPVSSISTLTEISASDKMSDDVSPVGEMHRRSTSLTMSNEKSGDGRDFTQRPMSYKHSLKLQWMKSSGSLVQLFMFVVAVVNTNLFGGILLLMSFYFFSKFWNMATKRARFNVVRFYVLSVIFFLMVYQAPLGKARRWTQILGLYKVHTSQGRVLIYMMVALWVFSQMQGRIFESENFRYVIRSIKRSEAVRFTRALHEHQSRVYKRMLDYNKVTRGRRERSGRLERLKVLKTSRRGVDALYEVCVEQEIEYLKNRQLPKDDNDEEKRKEIVNERVTKSGKFVRYLLRGGKWWMFEHIPLSSELRQFVGRYSTWPLYFFMVLAVVQTPSILSLVYPLILFLYLIPEQPRPPKAAWNFLMLYVYGVILFKYLARKPDLVTCSENVSFFGVTLAASGAKAKADLLDFRVCTIATGIFYDILVLLSLLWHRMFLYYRGLWDLRENEEDLRLRQRIRGRRCPAPSELEKTRDDKQVSRRSSGRPETFTEGSGSLSAPSLEGNYTPLGIEKISVQQQLLDAERVFDQNALSNKYDGDESAGDVLQEFIRVEEGTVDDDSYEAGASGSTVGEESDSHTRPPRTDGDLYGPHGLSSQDLRDDFSDVQQPYVPFGPGLRRRRPSTTDPMSRMRSFSRIDSDLQDLPVALPQRGSNATPVLPPTETRPNTWDSPSANTSADDLGPRDDRAQKKLRRIATAMFRGQSRRPSSVNPEGTFEHSQTLRTLVQENEIDNRLSKHRRNDSSSSEEDLARIGDSGRSALETILEEPSAVENDEGSIPSDRDGAQASTDRDNKKKKPKSDSHQTTLVPEKVGFFSPIAGHFRRLLQSHQHKAVGDYYLLIFFTDFICFVYMIFGYSFMFSTTLTDNDVNTWWSSNFISTKQLLSLFGMFVVLILDRVIYLKRSMAWKLVLHYGSIFVYHYVLFILTSISNRVSVKIFYMIKCIYFLLSALQIRSGFPQYTTGQYLLRNYSVPGLVAFEIYNYIPFLWLTRTLLDWVVLPTSLELFQYFRFIDIYVWLYRNRAVNQGRGSFKRVLGQKRGSLPRLYQGYGLFILCVLLLFFPFLLFSFFNPFFSPRELSQSTLSMKLTPSSSSSYELFSRSTNISSNVLKRSVDFKTFEDTFNINTQVRERERVYLAKIPAVSQSIWTPAPPDLVGLTASLKESIARNITAQLSFSFLSETAAATFRATSTASVTTENSAKLLEALDKQENASIVVENAVDRYWLLTSGSRTFQVAARGPGDVCVRLHYDNMTTGDLSVETTVAFWSVTDCLENCSELCRNRPSNELIDVDDEGVSYLLQVADVSSINVGGGTILTVFSAILFTIASLSRSWFSNKRLIVPYVDMPYTLHLYQLVNDILYARQDHDLEMEEILYNGLIDLYRDTSTLVKWSGERRLKTKERWWEGPDGYKVFPSYKETATEPYIRRIVD